MFEEHIAPSGVARRLPVTTAISFGAHGLIVALVLAVAGARAHKAKDKEVNVAFVGNRGGTPPPPPPPPARRRHTVKKTKFEVPKRVEIPRELPKVVEAPPPEPEPELDEPDDGVEGGVEGGVKGGVVGGVVGGVLGGKVGGEVGAGGPPPPPPTERPKPKNVPIFVAQRTAIRMQWRPRFPEMFKQANRGKSGIAGMYKVCVDLDGHVYDVIPVKSVPGADASIIEGLKEDWLFQPQPQPVCFLYNMPITIQ